MPKTQFQRFDRHRRMAGLTLLVGAFLALAASSARANFTNHGKLSSSSVSIPVLPSGTLPSPLRYTQMIRHRFVGDVVVASLLAPWVSGGDLLAIESRAGGVVAISAEGAVVWRVETPGDQAPLLRRPGDGRLVVNESLLVSAAGRILASRAPSTSESQLSTGAAGSAWSDLFALVPLVANENDSISRLLIDSEGDFWAINKHLNGGSKSLQVRESVGATGNWGPLETIGTNSQLAAFATPEGMIDQNDNITIVYRNIGGGNQSMFAMRLDAGGIWQGPTLIFADPDFFQTIEAGTDAAGHAIAVFDQRPDVGPSFFRTMSSSVRDPLTGQWSQAAAVSDPTLDAVLPTVVQNRSGDAVYLIYLVRGGGPVALFAHRFDSATGTWGPAVMLPDSGIAATSLAIDSRSRFPCVVDDAGNVTVFFEAGNQTSGFEIFASRMEGGRWQLPQPLLGPGGSTLLAVFSNADVTPAGDVLAVATRIESTSYRFYAFGFAAGQGWKTTANPSTSSLLTTTRARVIFFDGLDAIATLLVPKPNGDPKLSSLLHTDSGWLPGLFGNPLGIFCAWFGPSPWIDLGNGLAGTNGVPSLAGEGKLVEGELVTVTLTDALESALAFRIVGLTAVNVPFMGGTLVPAFAPPGGNIVPLLTDPAGGSVVSGSVPPGLPAGLELFAQYWIQDPGAPFGFSASNAIMTSVP